MPREFRRVNVVRVAEDEDFAQFRRMCDDHEGWNLVFSKKNVHIWVAGDTMHKNSDFKMIKARTMIDDVSADTIYDVLHDGQYRRTWDAYMQESADLGMLNPNNDLSYYALKTPTPLTPRDFVLQRSWLATQDEMIIMNHSVCHDDYPPRKNYIRGISYITGYLVRPASSNSCQLTYLTQSDPKGALPSWVTNKITQMVAPKVFRNLHKAARAYPAWKQRHDPSHKPWLQPNPDAKRVDLSKCVPRDDEQSPIDESNVMTPAPTPDVPTPASTTSKSVVQSPAAKSKGSASSKSSSTTGASGKRKTSKGSASSKSSTKTGKGKTSKQKSAGAKTSAARRRRRRVRRKSDVKVKQKDGEKEEKNDVKEEIEEKHVNSCEEEISSDLQFSSQTCHDVESEQIEDGKWYNIDVDALYAFHHADCGN